MNAARAESLLSARFPARRAAITGGASGLGLAAARILAAGGWKIALLDLGLDFDVQTLDRPGLPPLDLLSVAAGLPASSWLTICSA